MQPTLNTAATPRIACAAMRPTRPVSSLSEDVARGLFSAPRSLPPKYFYDERGSLLFDRICDVPEYYPTRTESALLEEIAGEVIGHSQPARIVELGSGTSRKTRHLLDACDRMGCHPLYAPVDVCDEILVTSGEALSVDYQWLDVRPLVGDYTAGLGNLPRREGRNLVVFLGGTIGNFAPGDARDFLREVRTTMSAGDSLLIGADRVKEPDVLHAAYNDDAGLTAEFNLNVLRVLNRELGADFDLGGFEHYAHFNPLESRIEMHLIAMRNQVVRLDGFDGALEFHEGDNILTEISCKFTRAALEELLVETGFEVDRHYESAGLKFSLVLARPA
ncbi:MAG: L-histidine N(alpha)-methyltransferase [Gammaproteobacteria bacterium]|nr:L-histidine N(alpha)-methyltransferase [Gammaproteobacteria bacterium]